MGAICISVCLCFLFVSVDESKVESILDAELKLETDSTLKFCVKILKLNFTTKLIVFNTYKKVR